MLINYSGCLLVLTERSKPVAGIPLDGTIVAPLGPAALRLQLLSPASAAFQDHVHQQHLFPTQTGASGQGSSMKIACVMYTARGKLNQQRQVTTLQGKSVREPQACNCVASTCIAPAVDGCVPEAEHKTLRKCLKQTACMHTCFGRQQTGDSL